MPVNQLLDEQDRLDKARAMSHSPNLMAASSLVSKTIDNPILEAGEKGTACERVVSFLCCTDIGKRFFLCTPGLLGEFTWGGVGSGTVLR